MINYSTINDDALWELAKQGDSDAEEQLIINYKKLVIVYSRTYYLIGGESEDLIQEGMLGILDAIRGYSPSGDASFKTFVEHCVKNRIISAVRAAGRQKHTPLNDSISIESLQFGEFQSGLNRCIRDPEDVIISRERIEEITAGRDLSRFEAGVLKLFLEGLSYIEIGERMGKPVKSVDNAVQRIRKKLSRYL